MIERLVDKQKPCTYCTEYGHTAWKCPRKTLDKVKAGTYKGLKISSSLGGQRKPMKRTKMKPIGKVGKAIRDYVDEWKATQKPGPNGMYTCYISGRQIPYLMAEHPYSKVRHPELRTNQKLEPVAAEINKLKGSLDITDFLEKYPEYKTTVKPEYLDI